MLQDCDRAGRVSRIRFGRGVSLVELMVSMVLGLLLMLGIVRVYLDSKLNYTADEEVARVQENGRFALNLLKRELTLAGFYAGDLSVKDMAPAAVTTDCAATDWALDPTDPIDLVSDYNNSLLTVNGATLTCLTEADGLVHVLPGTDVITIKRTAGDFTVRNGAYHRSVSAAKQEQWYLRRRNHGSDKAWIYVAAGGAFNSNHIGTNTEVDYWEFHTRIFYIRDYAQAVGDGIPTLCVSELVGRGMTSACLLAGVEDMQVEFGIDTTGDGVPNRFDNTPSATDLSTAVVARVSLLLRSTGPLPGYINTKAYRLGQKTIAAKNDGFYRRVMTTTVQTRNTHLPLAR